MLNSGLTITQVGTLLQATVPMLQAELATLPEPLTRFRPAAGEWSVNEVLGHLIEAEERGFAGRIRRILTQPGYVCEGWDPNQVARDRRDHEKAAAALLAELAARRDQSMTLVQGLTSAQLLRTAEHPVVGLLSVNDLLHEWIHHDRNHIKQILSNVQALVWPALGNAQKFTTTNSD